MIILLYPLLFLLASERSERDTYRGNTIENRGCLFIYLFIYMFGRMYVILGRGRTRSEHKNTEGQCSLRVRPRPKLHQTESSSLATITRITLVELYTALNSFAGAVKTQKLMGAPFLFELVAICHSYKPYSTALTCKFIVH